MVTGVATDKTAGPDVARLIGLDCNPIALRTSFAGTLKNPALWPACSSCSFAVSQLHGYSVYAPDGWECVYGTRLLCALQIQR